MNNINWDELEIKSEATNFIIEEIELSYTPITESFLFEHYNEYTEAYQTKQLNKDTGKEEEITKKRANSLKLFKLKLINLDCKVPGNIVKKWLDLKEEKEFRNLSPEEKYKILGKIDIKGFLKQIINKIQSVDEPSEEVKKN